MEDSGGFFSEVDVQTVCFSWYGEENMFSRLGFVLLRVGDSLMNDLTVLFLM